MNIVPDDIVSMQAALERCEGYITLGMLNEAREELRSVPEDLRTTFPYMATCMNLCLRFHWWEEGAELGRNLVLRWPANDEVRAATIHCMMQSGHEMDGLLLYQGIIETAPRPTSPPKSSPKPKNNGRGHDRDHGNGPRGRGEGLDWTDRWL